MTGTVLIRAQLTENEWARIRKIAIDQKVTASQLVGQSLREHLLKGKRK